MNQTESFEEYKKHTAGGLRTEPTSKELATSGRYQLINHP